MQLDLICSIQESNQLGQSEHSDGFEHGYHLQILCVAVITREKEQSQIVEGDGGHYIQEEHAPDIIFSYLFLIRYLLASCRMKEGGEEVHDDVDSEEGINDAIGHRRHVVLVVDLAPLEADLYGQLDTVVYRKEDDENVPANSNWVVQLHYALSEQFV